MLKQVITLFVLLATFTTSSFAQTENGLKQAFDEMSYNLTVEWDQKDPQVLEQEIAKFESYIATNNVSSNQLLGLVKSVLKDEKLLNELKELSLATNAYQMSFAEFNELMSKSSMKGASWSGNVPWEALLIYGTLNIAIAVVAFIAMKWAWNCAVMNRSC